MDPLEPKPADGWTRDHPCPLGEIHSVSDGSGCLVKKAEDRIRRKQVVVRAQALERSNPRRDRDAFFEVGNPCVLTKMCPRRADSRQGMRTNLVQAELRRHDESFLTDGDCVVRAVCEHVVTRHLAQHARFRRR